MALNLSGRGGALPAALPGSGKKSLGNRGEGENAINCPDFDCFSRHTEDNASLFVLSNGTAACPFYCKHSPDAVGTHAREDGGGGIWAGSICDGMKQFVDCWTLEANQGTIFYFDSVILKGFGGGAYGNCPVRSVPDRLRVYVVFPMRLHRLLLRRIRQQAAQSVARLCEGRLASPVNRPRSRCSRP
jgi:hypothetical protein